MSAIDVEALILGALALLFLAVWLRDREPGLAWLAAGFTLVSAWYFNAGRLAAVGNTIDTPLARLGAVVIGIAVLLVAVGVMRYVGGPTSTRLRLLLVALCVPAVLLTLAPAIGLDVNRRVFHIGVLLAYAAAGIKALARIRSEPGAGHGLLAAMLFAQPLLPVLMLLGGIPSAMLRYLAGIPVVLFGLILLTVCLLRRRRALQQEVERRTQAEAALRDTNADLERRVARRTAHLHELIGALEAFNRNVSHDLRGPLGGIAQLSRLAGEALAAGRIEAAERWLRAIASQADASRQLVGTLLDLARIGEGPLVRRRVSLAALVDEAFGEAQLGCMQPGQRPPRLACSELPDVMADPALLRPVLVNLFGNAVKFTRDAADPQIDVGATVDHGDVTVTVADNGVGFDPAQSTALFQPFQRLHDAAFEGSGLGLSIVRQAVERHGGRVWATSTPGRGATFGFTLPGATVAVAAPGASAEPVLVQG